MIVLAVVKVYTSVRLQPKKWIRNTGLEVQQFVNITTQQYEHVVKLQYEKFSAF